MKDIVITSKAICRELYWVLASFVLAVCTNIGAIIAYDRPWTELLSQIGYVVFITLGIYVILLVLRGVWALLSLPFRKK